MPYMTIKLADYPEIKALVQAADPKYKKHSATVWVAETVTLSGTYWDGGSRSTYAAVNIATKRVGPAPQYDPPQFGGPRQPPKVELPRGAVIIETGFFCGKPRTATVYVRPEDVFPTLPGMSS